MSARRMAELVPQHGAMVLLDVVVRHDEGSLVARVTGHRDRDHPLLHAGRLPVWAGVEYAAQAMAAHFSLSSRVRGEATLGLLGGLRDVVCATEFLDDVEQALLVAVERLSRDVAGSIYAFRLTGEADGREFLRGRATVVQQVQGQV